MRKHRDITRIERDVESLPAHDQHRLVERLLRRLQNGKARTLNWTALYGAGKGLWGGVDAQRYVRALRENRV